MFDIKEETNKEAFFECLRLGERHYNEVEAKASHVKYNVNYEMAGVFIDHNLIRLVTARKNGELVGYFGVVVMEDFVTSKISAKELGIYVSPEMRGTSCFFRMTKAVEKILQDEGVGSLILCFKEGHDSGLAQRLGYSPTEIAYQKSFGG